MSARIGLGLLTAGMLALAAWLGIGALTAAAAPAVSAAQSSVAVGAAIPDAPAAAAITPDVAAAPAVTAEEVPAPVTASVTEQVATETATARSIATLVDAAWVDRVARATGIPPRALTAYAGAALQLAAEQPACGLGWNTLAALGEVESGHGTHAGSAIAADGVARPAIVGPALDGGAYDGITDSDAGAFDADPVWDRAVGPFQFIPTTWARWGADASGDGRADPQQVDDAALAAARYLCHYGAQADPATWRAAVYAYNHVDSYVDLVAATATEYAARAAAGA